MAHSPQSARCVRGTNFSIAYLRPLSIFLPGAVGLMILGIYALIMAAFLVLFARDTEAGLMVAISGVYFTVYFTRALFRTEGRSGDIDPERFLRDGLDTWTGHVGGHEAIVQILLIPVALAVAITAIGIISIMVS